MQINSITLSCGDISHSLPIPGPLRDLAVRLSRDFVSSLSQNQDPNGNQTTETAQPSSAAEILVLYFHHVALIVRDKREGVSEAHSTEDELLDYLIEHFEATFLRGSGIHSLVTSLPGTTQQHIAVIRAYFVSVGIAGSAPRVTESALFNDSARGKATVYAVFGGQGLTDDVLGELRTIYATYPSLVADFITRVSQLLNRLAKDVDASNIYEPYGLDVLGWLEDPLQHVDKSYLLSAPVSMPLIGLLTLCRYCVLCKCVGQSPGEMRKLFAGVSGHSQGIVAAAAIAAADTWEDFYRIAADSITVLFWIGFRCQKAQPQTVFTRAEVEDSYSHNEGHPSPMLNIRGLSRDTVQSHVSAMNSHLDDAHKVHVSLINGNDNIVISGPPRSLRNLNVHLRKFNASPKVNQARLPHGQRKATFIHEFLQTTVPFHSPYLASAFQQILKDVANISISKDSLCLPLFGTHTGQDLKKHDESNIVPALVRMIVLEPVNWPQTSAFPGASHILDFGPGGLSGAVALLKNAKQGRGTRLILASDYAGSDKTVGYLSELLSPDQDAVHYERSWIDLFGPKLAQTSTGRVYVDTKLSRLLSLPPVMVAGMTPTTVPWDFVAATMNAGYHVELAGGGYLNTRDMTEAIEKIIDHAPRGRGVTCNFIYINPRAITWQIAMVRQLLAKGVNVEGITIGAGVPSLEVAHQYIELGLKHISFKPGTIEAILQVIAIAQAHPNFPIILQWTGGRGGGHHSAEDFHQPLLATYGRIRQHKNLILVVGSGFGEGEDTYPYLTGAWSTKFSYPAMPVDGILLGSRLMVSKEAHTSIQAKNIIVAAPGVDDGSWADTYNGEAGGVISVQSEMGEAIHKIATRGTRLWAEMDRTIFSLERGKRLAELKKKKSYIIQRLNADFQKPWFGKNKSGEPVDLEDMTYLEVLTRAIDLLYVKHQARWIDVSLQRPVEDFFHRIEQRFSTRTPSSVLSQEALDDPSTLIKQVAALYPESDTELMKHEDVGYFLSIFRRPGQKPAPFIPRLDDDFEYWFKKDSLWQSEDVDAVVDQDVQRTCILQGPVAVKYSRVVNEPVKYILDRIHTTHIQWLLGEMYCNNLASIPRVEYFGGEFDDQAPESIEFTGLQVFRTDNKITCAASSLDPNAFNQISWNNLLAGRHRSWRRALFTTDFIIRDGIRIANPVHRLFAPRENVEVEILYPEEKERTVITLKEKSPHTGTIETAIEIRRNANSAIQVSLLAKPSAQAEGSKLVIIYNYHPDAGYGLISEDSDHRILQIKNFYYQLWFGEERPPMNMPLSHTFVDKDVTVSRSAIEQYICAIGGQHKQFGSSFQSVPLDLGIVLGWKVLMKPLFLDSIDGDLLNLVHLSNEFRFAPDATPLKEGDVVDVSSRITGVTINDAGKVVTVAVTIQRQNMLVVQVTSSFQYRGVYKDYNGTFKEQDEVPLLLSCNSESEVAVLRSKPWFHYHGADEFLLRSRLKFELRTCVTYKSKDTWSSVRTSGDVYAESTNKSWAPVASVKYEGGESQTNPVIDYLTRNGQRDNQKINLDHAIPLSLDNEPLTFTTPRSNIPYAHASRDYNPIHMSKSFSQLAGLPGTITHGMHTSAIVRNLIELNMPGCDVGTFRRFSCSFVGMVLPQDTLEAKVEHVAMMSGRKILSVVVSNVDTGEKVLQGEAEIDQPATAYVFTGQGSQAQNMGMDLYNKSPVAKAIWDRVDKYMMDNFGFSILYIVKNNPRKLTIPFGGRRGWKIRENYLAMKIDRRLPDGSTILEPIIKELTETSESYTFSAPDGLLFATQFAQVSITLHEKAAFEDMRARGLITENSMFAGHSLGEYAGLLSIADILPVEKLIRITFYRGLCMQAAMDRDEAGRTEYSMCAVDPSRVSKRFTEHNLQEIVNLIAERCNCLLQIVNYNITGQQYVCGGHLRALTTLAEVLNRIHAGKIALDRFGPKSTMKDPSVTALIDECAAEAARRPMPIVLKRGVATIPLAGIDVPFHSTHLRPGVQMFRDFLIENITEDGIQAEKLVGRYLPNLIAKPFEISKDYVAEVFELTSSPKLKDILEEWNRHELLA